MDEWMGGWMDGCMCGWMDGWVDGWMGKWMDGWVNAHTNDYYIAGHMDRGDWQATLHGVTKKSDMTE